MTNEDPSISLDMYQLHTCLAPHYSRGLVVAYSGGVDSHVLLHALVQLKAQHGFVLHAIHINHGLHPSAADWQRHCATVCQQWGVLFHTDTVAVIKVAGESVEALARAARYDAIVRLMPAGSCVVTAHHQNDQMETILLQLFRGAGPQGLAGIAPIKPLGSGICVRPLLEVPRRVIAAYATSRRLVWLDDPSNIDTRYDRNFLRHQVIPLLQNRWPGLVGTVTRSGQHCAALQAWADDYCDSCLTTLAIESNQLDAEQLATYSLRTQALIIRRWLQRQGQSLPPQKKLNTLLYQLKTSRSNTQPSICWDELVIRRYRSRLYLTRHPLPTVPTVPVPWSDISQPLDLPDGLGTLTCHRAAPPGHRIALNAAILTAGTVTVRFRQGGERIQLAGQAIHHTLKSLMQTWGIPPWRRSRIPLIYVDDQLCGVAGQPNAVAQSVAATPEQPAVFIEWQPLFFIKK